MGDDQSAQALWNFDLAELILIFQLKAEFINHMTIGNLEGAYWSARRFRMEVDAKLSRSQGKKLRILDIEKQEFEEEDKKNKKKSEKLDVDEQLQDLQNYRNNYNGIKKPNLDQWGEYFIKLEEFYMKLCLLCKIHGLYFREGEDNGLAVLRR